MEAMNRKKSIFEGVDQGSQEVRSRNYEDVAIKAGEFMGGVCPNCEHSLASSKFCGKTGVLHIVIEHDRRAACVVDSQGKSASEVETAAKQLREFSEMKETDVLPFLAFVSQPIAPIKFGAARQSMEQTILLRPPNNIRLASLKDETSGVERSLRRRTIAEKLRKRVALRPGYRLDEVLLEMNDSSSDSELEFAEFDTDSEDEKVETRRKSMCEAAAGVDDATVLLTRKVKSNARKRIEKHRRVVRVVDRLYATRSSTKPRALDDAAEKAAPDDNRLVMLFIDEMKRIMLRALPRSTSNEWGPTGGSGSKQATKMCEAITTRYMGLKTSTSKHTTPAEIEAELPHVQNISEQLWKLTKALGEIPLPPAEKSAADSTALQSLVLEERRLRSEILKMEIILEIAHIPAKALLDRLASAEAEFEELSMAMRKKAIHLNVQ
jgi:hypothetical protein